MSGPVAESKAIANRLQKIEDDSRTGVHHETSTGEVLPPAKYFQKDERDDYYQTKSAVTEDIGTGRALGNQVLITDEDIKYLQSQKTKEELSIFDRWCYETFQPGADPNKIALFRELNPGWFERRETEISKQIDIAKKLAKLGLRGPRTQEELYLMYALDQKMITPPDLDMLFPEKAKVKMANLNDARKKQMLTQGYWNPRQYTKQRGVSARKLDSTVQPFITPDGAAPGNAFTQVQAAVPGVFNSYWGQRGL